MVYYYKNFYTVYYTKRIKNSLRRSLEISIYFIIFFLFYLRITYKTPFLVFLYTFINNNKTKKPEKKSDLIVQDRNSGLDFPFHVFSSSHMEIFLFLFVCLYRIRLQLKSINCFHIWKMWSKFLHNASFLFSFIYIYYMYIFFIVKFIINSLKKIVIIITYCKCIFV